MQEVEQDNDIHILNGTYYLRRFSRGAESTLARQAHWENYGATEGMDQHCLLITFITQYHSPHHWRRGGA